MLTTEALAQENLQACIAEGIESRIVGLSSVPGRSRHRTDLGLKFAEILARGDGMTVVESLASVELAGLPTTPAAATTAEALLEFAAVQLAVPRESIRLARPETLPTSGAEVHWVFNLISSHPLAVVKNFSRGMGELIREGAALQDMHELGLIESRPVGILAVAREGSPPRPVMLMEAAGGVDLENVITDSPEREALRGVEGVARALAEFHFKGRRVREDDPLPGRFLHHRDESAGESG